MEGTWEPVTDRADQYASRAVPAGTDIDGSPVYIARAALINEVVPGKLAVRADRIHFYCMHNGQEIEIRNELVQFLVNDGYCWETRKRSNGQVPPNAVIGGTTSCGNDVYYIGRASHNEKWVPGKIDGNERCLIITHGGVHRKNEYHVLIRPRTMTAESINEDNENSSGCLDCLGRLFSDCRINITNSIKIC